MISIQEIRGIRQADLIPHEALEELIHEFRKRWPLREVPDNLYDLLEVLE